MRRLWLGSLFLLSPFPLLACSLCNPDLQRTATMGEGLTQARLVVAGSVIKSGLTGTGSGVSDFRVTAILKGGPILAGRTTLEVPRYVPVSDPKDPPRYLLFCDLLDGKIDVYRGIPVKSDAAVAYLKGLLTLEGKTPAERLRYCFDWLEHTEREVAQDAFLEFAKAADRDLGKVAATLAPEKLRRWLKDPQTPDIRLGVYAFLLGACGKSEDAEMLRGILLAPGERFENAFDGVLSGYLQLRPREGWELALAILGDSRRSFPIRFSVHRTLRFFHGWKPEESRSQVLAGMRVVLAQSDMADLAVEDLRRWKVWDLTSDVTRLYGARGYEAPIIQQALVRYALSCPQPEARALAERIRARDPQLHRSVAESLQGDK